MSSARVILIRHNDDVCDDRVQSYFEAAGAGIETYRPFRGQTLPQPDSSLAAAVVFGGPFCVDQPQAHPFLAEENRFIEACVKADIPFLGICQGAQQLASVLGAYAGAPNDQAPANGREFGYYELTARPDGRALFPDGLVVPQFHFHTFAIPSGAQHLAGSQRFANQAFRYDSAYGFQFHAEVTKAGFRRWQERLADGHSGHEGAQTRAQQDTLMARHDASIHTWFMAFMDQHFGPVMQGRAMQGRAMQGRAQTQEAVA